MRKLSSLASRASPSIHNHPKPVIPTNPNSPKYLAQNPNFNNSQEPTSTCKSQFKDSAFNSLSVSKSHILAKKQEFKKNPIDHSYFREILASKDCFLLLNHELKAKRVNLNTQTIVSILQNQENPVHNLRFYIWVCNISSSFAKNHSVRGALSNALYRKGPVLLSAELVEEIRKSICRVTEDLLCLLIGSWGRLGLARYCADVFEQVSYLGISPSTTLYNAVIDALVKSNSLDLAYLKFHQMEADNCVPNRVTYNILIHGVCKAGVIDEALRLVKQMERLGYSPNVFTYTILIDGYCAAKKVDEVFRIVERMKERNVKPNNVTYRSLVNGVFNSVSPKEAFKLLSEWVDREKSLPKVAYDSILCCLCNNSLPNEAAMFLSKAAQLGYVPDSSNFNVAMTCFIKGLDLEQTCRIFDDFDVNIDFSTCLALVEALYKSGKEGKGDEYLNQMVQNGSVFSYNIVIDCFCKAKMMNRASEKFEEMRQKGVFPNLVTFNTLISGYCAAGNVSKAREFLQLLLDNGFKPDIFTFGSIIRGLCQVNQIADAFDCLFEMAEWGVAPNAIVYNILMRALCLDGDVDKAMRLFRKMQVDGIRPDFYSFNSLIQGFCRKNEIDKARGLVKSMLSFDLRPDNFTYIAFINALCESGRIDEAKELFFSMEGNGCVPDAQTCNTLLNGLVKSGTFEEARDLWSKYNERGMRLKPVPFD